MKVETSVNEGILKNSWHLELSPSIFTILLELFQEKHMTFVCIDKQKEHFLSKFCIYLPFLSASKTYMIFYFITGTSGEENYFADITGIQKEYC